MPERRDFYVYVHKDRSGNVFYVGKGTGRRAWSRDRDYIWAKYVDRIGGEYSVEIVEQDLSESEALEIEWDLICRLGPQLVNWVNPGREIDCAACEKYWRLKKANQAFVAATRPLEKADLDRAIERYRTALVSLREYEELVLERGLVADLTERQKVGDMNIIDRLTLCLARKEDWRSLITEGARYFEEYPDAQLYNAGKRVLKRMERAQAKLAATADGTPAAHADR